MNITPIEITVADIFSGFKDNQEAGVERALHIRAFTPGQNKAHNRKKICNVTKTTAGISAS